MALNLNKSFHPSDEEILGKLKADGFAEAKDEDYEKVRKLTSILD